MRGLSTILVTGDRVMRLPESKHNDWMLLPLPGDVGDLTFKGGVRRTPVGFSCYLVENYPKDDAALRGQARGETRRPDRLGVKPDDPTVPTLKAPLPSVNCPHEVVRSRLGLGRTHTSLVLKV